MAASKDLEPTRKYLLQRVSDAFLVCHGLEGPVATDHLKSIEQVIYGNPTYVKTIDSFLRGDDGNGTASPGCIFFYLDADTNIVTTAEPFVMKQRTIVASRLSPYDAKGKQKPISIKEQDMTNELHIQIIDIDTASDNKVKEAHGRTYLEFHKQQMKTLYEPLLLKQSRLGKVSSSQRDIFHDSLRLLTDKLEELSENQLQTERITMPDAASMRNLPPNANFMKAATDSKLVRQFESAAEGWITVASKLVYEKPEYSELEPQNIPEDIGPSTELKWWKERCAKFNNLTAQLSSPEVKQVTGVLAAARSPVLRQWKEIDGKLTDGASEAKENVRYLSSLEKYFEALERESPSVLLNILPPLVNNIQMMYTIARYYNTEKHMMVLFCKITNQLIVACKNDIRQGQLSASHLWSQTNNTQSLRALIERLNACILLKGCYVDEFRAASVRLEPQTGGNS
eukprot:TRINITY_DN14382_c2_g3_i1.p1 TRINITY_DN14382_c2_g3~~TRINITY_DN14382_c2_g3_i1.p1  ORF type:complete len:455 (+),score=94.61 TRINITY_DN14382_c2_g3_i1:121-1485(+)